ncbi:hypothetical protein Aab01nite_43930 [Paractinoplanes abujensis]|uniref:Uncharacterized protein n=1 Tax=Paractinoplanes abujensis TaxID=882441 RepID=A0A7W7CK91_9ACTN|nr:hypothetical protein [Actinoplanes abujensis]MBB4690030.1 hypothetical protein [Actinoplanes abujensis]GID20803.1 hypothetical protein Aab01nite_43930 [Actinoplanes abujensis]
MPVTPTQFLAPRPADDEQSAPHTADRGEAAMRQLRDPFAVDTEPRHPGHRDPHPA